MPLDGVDSQGQENKDVRKSVGSLLMSSMEVSRLEQRAYIKITVLRGQNARGCHAQLLEAVGARALPYRTVARWVATFESGREATKDKPRTGLFIRNLVDGDYFGEIALVAGDKKRMATILAVDISEVYRLDRKDYEKCILPDIEAYEALKAAAAERLKQTLLEEEKYKMER
ncbi:hypothetical protein C0J52_24036 [Blattella germanica]|nr:hypothetical protein C0J52_24036 [Blattella germanica]